MLLQLYCHFPFCKRKCEYCDFCSAPAAPGEVEAYCRALEREIVLEGARWRDAEVSTVFLGGGTPSVVPAPLMDGVLSALETSFAIRRDAEFTAEANPGTVTEAWLETLISHGMNRLSLGVQAAQDGLLRSLGRIHTFAQAREAAETARRMGVNNLSVDLMFGLPGQTPADYRDSIDGVCGLSPRHISAYSLILEEGTPLCEKARAGKIAVPDDDAAAELYQTGLERLEARGFYQYEISNFAKEGYRCRHNIGYWQGAWYLGLGVAAHGMLPPGARAAEGAVRVRTANTEDRRAYVDALLADRLPPRETAVIGREEAMFETMMLGLRMNEGVGNGDFQARFGASLDRVYGGELASLVRDGLGRWNGERFALTARGLMVQNDALLRLMKECEFRP